MFLLLFFGCFINLALDKPRTTPSNPPLCLCTSPIKNDSGTQWLATTGWQGSGLLIGPGRRLPKEMVGPWMATIKLQSVFDYLEKVTKSPECKDTAEQLIEVNWREPIVLLVEIERRRHEQSQKLMNLRKLTQLVYSSWSTDRLLLLLLSSQHSIRIKNIVLCWTNGHKNRKEL